MTVTVTLSEFLNTSNKKESLLYRDYSHFSTAGIMKNMGLPSVALKCKNEQIEHLLYARCYSNHLHVLTHLIAIII